MFFLGTEGPDLWRGGGNDCSCIETEPVLVIFFFIDSLFNLVGLWARCFERDGSCKVEGGLAGWVHLQMMIRQWAMTTIWRLKCRSAAFTFSSSSSCSLKGFLAYSGACCVFLLDHRIWSGGVVGEVCPGHGWHHIHMIMSTMYLNISLLSIILYCNSTCENHASLFT